MNLNSIQKQNIEYLIKSMNAKGLTNPFTQAGILSVASKESGFIPKSETSYSTTSASRIRNIFGSRVAGLSDSQIDTLKKNDVAFFDQVYGPKTEVGRQLGNTQTGDGYKYRGRGFNQITFKNSYKKYGDAIGVDLVSNPDRLNEVGVASDALIQYFIDAFKSRNAKLSQYNTTGLNDFKSLDDSVKAIYHANAGWGKSLDRIAADPTGGRAKAIERAPSFYDLVKSYTGKTVEVAKKGVEVVQKNLVPTIVITTALITGVFILYKTIKK
jgi:predicted chitinase